MAGLIDVGILKPDLANTTYREAEQSKQQLASGRQKLQLDEMTLQRLKDDQIALADLQAKLRAAGKSDDPKVFFRALIETGKPDYMIKGYDGLQRYEDQLEYGRIVGRGASQTAPTTAPGAITGPAAPTTPSSAPATSEDRLGDFISQIEAKRNAPTPMPAVTGGAMGQPLAPSDAAPPMTNNLAPAAPAPTNAMIAGAAPAAAAPAGANQALVTQTQTRINNLLEFAGRSKNQQMATNALSQAKILQDQLELYSKREAGPVAPSVDLIGVADKLGTPVYFDKRTDQQFTITTDPSGQQVRKPYSGAVNRSTSNVTATATSAGTPVAKSLAGTVGARAETSLAKAEGASGIMESANMVRDALNTGNVIAGPLAGVRTKFAQVLELAGAGDKEKLVNTRNAIQGLATLTLESRAELKGQGQVTENEQKLLERARSGNIEDMTIAELQSIVNVSQRLAGRLWSSHQNLLKTMETDPAAADSLRYYKPTMSLPQAVGEGKPKAEVDKRQQGLANIFGGKK